jgi:hypothetical protein
MRQFMNYISENEMVLSSILIMKRLMIKLSGLSFNKH